MYLDIDTFTQSKQDEIIQNILDSLEFTISLREDEALVERFNYLANNDDYDLNVLFDYSFDKNFFDQYEIEESSIRKDVLLARIVFAPSDNNPMLDTIDVAHAIVDLDEDGDENISTMILTLE